ncbi:MAG: hypothetical protein FWF31_11080 [Desulfobulbus sp.]|nr:hypothetical protein [Desulfobulbus sp.]
MRCCIAFSETEYEQAVLIFRHTLYNALAEMENGFSARQRYREQAEHLERSLVHVRQSEALYQVRYQAGGSPLKSWLDA